LLHNETDQDIKQSEDIRPARKIKGKKWRRFTVGCFVPALWAQKRARATRHSLVGLFCSDIDAPADSFWELAPWERRWRTHTNMGTIWPYSLINCVGKRHQLQQNETQWGHVTAGRVLQSRPPVVSVMVKNAHPRQIPTVTHGKHRRTFKICLTVKASVERQYSFC
jgi:hypothetical protein